MAVSTWAPPTEITRDEIVATSRAVLARPDLAIDAREDLFRIRVAELDWDIGGKVYEPVEADNVLRGADGKKVGIFLLHGGGGDHRSQEPLALLLAGKFGVKVATMTYPGSLYLGDPSRQWPGDTVNSDGTARTPMWNKDSPITPDQYELIQDRSDPTFRAKYGTLLFLRAREGTEFYDRLASWPLAFEEAMKEVCRRNFPVGEFSIYMHGHSTGGPFAHMLLQRVENIAGLVGTESSPYGGFFSKMLNQIWPYPFNYITVRSWRDIARYWGPEHGVEGLRRLPWLMEEVFAEWERRRHLPGIKAQQLVQFAGMDGLEGAARATAKRLRLEPAETEALVKRYRGYPYPLAGPGVKPVPPLLYGITSGSRDHTFDRYDTILRPALAALDPAPKVHIFRYLSGVHSYLKPEPDLPSGLGPVIGQVWHDAISGGYYLPG